MSLDETTKASNSSFMDKIRQVIHDAVDYGASALRLFQAEVASLALSSVVFLALILFSALATVVAFALLSVALGIWLAHVAGGAIGSLLIIGGTYALLALALGGYAMRWLKRLKS